MKLHLERVQLDPDVTIGELSIDGERFCWVCEDAVRGDGVATTVDQWKIKGKTAIPYGSYQVIVTMSARFGKLLPLLVDVPGFEGIRIHPGNTAADTEGCLLPGRDRLPKGVGKSGLAFADLMDHINEARRRGEPVSIDVVKA